ncbi:hypothetical protein PFFVO_02018, partial [Plasmodium falciparum Vietnam Oak-Knoll (FVO)]
MARGGRRGTNKSAKEVLDEIGQKVYEQVKRDAETYKDELKGQLSQVSTNSETITFTDTCTFEYTEHTSVAKGNTNPCGNDGKEDVKRFSKERVAEYDEKKIRGSNDGACPPYRRLSLCNKNLENIKTNIIDNKHDLLAEVCMAAKYEGESIKTHLEQYDTQYPGSGSTICTALARSFADIGDIVRGKDLYSGNTKEKNRRDQLEKNLKEIFGDIYNDVTSSGNNKEVLKARYNGDTDNYYKLREDWWTANRETVWKAITCGAPEHASYFRVTCSDEQGGAEANHKCRCPKSRDNKSNDQVPTYFDYVPQYLRWFEEWGEDFCRKKKIYVGIVKKYCRGNYRGEERYCSRNGYDCEQTISRIGKVRMGKGCTDCFFACHSYENWIDNERKQFDKQKERYNNVINGTSRSSRKTRAATTTNYDGYESKFYNILKERDYRTVDAFLKLLNKEKACQAVKDKEGGTIDFKEVNSTSGGTAGSGSASGGTSDASGTNDINNGTFYHSQYCQVCPDCGVKHLGGGKFEDKDTTGKKCDGQKLYKPKKDAPHTPINILKSGEGRKEIEKKLNEFCDETKRNEDSLYEKWKCYKEDDIEKHGVDDDDEDDGNPLKAGGLCILENKNKNKGSETNSQIQPDEFQKTFYDFFTYWVAHMLKDSIYWRKKLKKFLENEKKKCGKEKYNKQCDCFQKWVKQKKEEEWTPIKTHFYKQKNLGEDAGFINFSPYYILEENLKLQFLKKDSEDSAEDSQSRDEDAEEMKHLKKILKLENENTLAVVNAGTEENTTIDKLLEQELKDAEQCKKCEDPQHPADKGAGRAITTPQPPVESDSESEDEGDDDDVSHVDEEDTAEEEEQEEPPTTDPSVDVCKTVAELFKDVTTLKNACPTKYDKYGREKFPNWKCISDSGGVTGTGGGDKTGTGGDATTTGKSDASGSICIPPRRRRLYVGKLQEWAEKQVGDKGESQTLTGGGSESTSDGKTPSQPDKTASQDPSDKLREAFIQSAAVETFFAWHKYKAENTKTQGGGVGVPEFLSRGTSEIQAVAPGTIPGGLAGGVESIPVPRPGVGVGGVPVVPGAGIPGAMPGVEGMPPGFPPGPQIPLPTQQRTGGLPGSHGGLQPTASLGQPLQPHLLNRVGVGTPEALPTVPRSGSDDKDPQSKLLNGVIPPDFLRLMFYTLGDYRDICIGGDRDIVGDTIVSNTEGSSSSKTKKISQIIEEMLSEQSGTTPPTPVTENSDEQRKKWWDENAKHIWHGMICALTYKENGAKGGTALEQIDEVKEKLFDTNKNTPIEKYQYNTVKLDDTSGDGRKTNEDTIQPATLKDFVERPPYFRYLEEWGENFCKERKKRLKQIYKECKVGQGNGKNGNKKCSGYGEDCEDQLEDEPTNVSDLKCPRCGRHCSSYTKWIQRKGKEFDEQKKAYVEQKDKCVNESNNHRNGFCGKLEENAAAFLQNLGSCKKDNGESNGNDHEEDEIKFDEKHKTFKQTEYCDPCSKFNINCKENGNCKRDTENKCNSKKGNDYITAKDIGNGGNSTHKLDMLVSDNSGNGFTGVLDECAGANIFKGIRKEEWECGNVCGYEVCIPQKGNSQKVKEKQNDEKHIITIRAL